MLKNVIYDYVIKSEGIEPLGQGSYGQVFPCHKMNEVDNQDYCVKIIPKDIRMDQKRKNQLDSEAAILQMQKLQNCENLVRVYDIFDEQEAIYIIMERCDYDLDKEFKSLQQQNQWYTYDDQIVIMQQIMNGQKFLFEHNIIHRDIKPHNILVKTIKKKTVVEEKVYKISDFGFAKCLENMFEQCDLTKLGSPAYAAPQFHFENALSSAKCDVFSYGILFYQIIFGGAFPYQISKYQLSNNLQQLQHKPFKCPKVEGKYGQQLEGLLERMIVYSEEKRISFQEIFSYPIMKIDVAQKPEDSVFSKLKMDLSEQKQKEINQERLREKKLDRLERISKILNVFYRKYLLVQSTQDQIQRGGKVEIEIIIFILDQIGLHYLLSVMGMIFGCISDIHQCFQAENDIPNLIDILKDCTDLAPQFPNHRVERIIMIQKYYQKRKNAQNLIDKLQVNLMNQSTKVVNYPQYMNLLKQVQENKIKLKKFVDFLEQMKSNLPIGMHQNIEKIIKLEEQYPIQRYQKVQLEEIFAQTDG